MDQVLEMKHVLMSTRPVTDLDLLAAESIITAILGY